MWNKFDPRPKTPRDNHWVVFDLQRAGKEKELKTCLGNTFRGEYLEEMLAEFERRGCTWSRYSDSCYTITCPVPAKDLVTAQERKNERMKTLGGCLYFLGFKLGLPAGLAGVAILLHVSFTSVWCIFIGGAILIAAVGGKVAKNDTIGRRVGAAFGIGLLYLAWTTR